MNIKHLETKDNTAKIQLTAKIKEISAARQTAIKKLAKNLTVKGFRKGNVPLTVAKKEIGEIKLKQETVNLILESGIIQLIKEKKFDLLSLPQLEKADTTKKNAWIFTLSLPLNPKIKLGEYKKTVKAILQKTKDKTKEQKLSGIISALIKKISITIPPILIDREVSQSLSRLVNQIEALNINLETYLKSINKTAEQVRQEYAKKAEENIKLDLILSRIAQDLKIKATLQEIQLLAKTSGLPAKRQQSLVPIIVRRKTLDQLLSL